MGPDVLDGCSNPSQRFLFREEKVDPPGFHRVRDAAKEPEAHLYILSKDTGFDSLLKHLKSKNVSAHRIKSVADLPLVKVSASKPVPDRVSVVIANLEQSSASRPRTLKTLGSTINGWFQKSLSDKEVSAIIAELTKRGIVAVNPHFSPASYCGGGYEHVYCVALGRAPRRTVKCASGALGRDAL